MSLRFIFGRAGCGKSTFCLNQIKNRIEKGTNSKLVLLVPEQFSFQSEKNLLSTIGEKNILNAEVLSFKRLCHRVFNEVGGVTHKTMNEAGKNMLIFKIVDQLHSKMKMFSTASKQQGFIDILSQTITEFKRYNITPEILKQSIESIKENQELKDKIEDLTLIYENFENKLHESYIDAEDELSILAQKIDECNLYDDAEIWIDEFTTFTPQQYVIIEKLLKKAKIVNITLCSDTLNGDKDIDNTDIFSTIKNTENKIVKIAADNRIYYESPIDLNKDCCPRFEASNELQHIENHFFSFPYKYYPEKVNNLRIYKALNTYDEVEKVSRDIIRLVRDKNYRFKDIAVVCRELESYEKLISVIFREYEIPYFLDKKREIMDNPLIVLITSIFDIFIKNWSYESVFRYLKTGILDISKEDIDILENYVLAHGIRGKKWTEGELWDYRVINTEKEMTNYEKLTMNRINETRDQVVEPLKKLYKNINKNSTVKEICIALYDFLIDIKALDKIENWSKDFQEKGNQEKSNEYSQIIDIVMQVLDQVVEVMGEEKIKLDKFVKILNVGFEKYEMGLIPVSIDEVVVGDIERIRSHNIKALYVIGVNDGVFPKGGREEGILSDEDRNILKEKGVELAADTKTKAFEEQFLVYNTLTIAREYLMLTYPVGDYEGKALRPSIIISRMKKLFPKLIEESDIVKINLEDPELEHIVSPISTFNELITELRRNYEGEDIEEIWSEVYKWYINKENWKEKAKIVFKGFEYSNQVEKADDKKIKALYTRPFYFDVSRIERYAECPFAYYVQYGLKAKDRKIYEFSYPDFGSFMHEVIDNFSHKLKEENISWRELDVDWCRKTISNLVDENIEVNSSILKSSGKYKYMAGRMKRIISKSVMIVSEHIKRSSFDPLATELKFGTGSKELKPIELSLPSGEIVKLRGRIDRVDAMELDGETYIRIIDYKSGNKEFSLSEVYYGLQLQLLVYLDAILSNADKFIKNQALPGAILYLRIDDPLVKGNRDMSDEEIEKQILKKLKMKGLLLADAKVIKEMDNNIEGYSLIIPARINKDGSLGNSSAITLEQFEILREYVRDTIVRLCEDMLSGDITIKPVKNNKYVSCKFCNFSSICQFDSSIKDNKYNYLAKKSDEDIWNLIYKKTEENLEGGGSDGRD